ncbi:hypothetical protein KY343_00630 [Candidatus Woesearchaeota archaeon]|nr:hypothetical protein [Candidatus Woesearchaeota archaeon]
MAFNFKNQNDIYLAFIAVILYLMWFIDVFIKLLAGKVYGLFLFCSLSLLIVCIIIINKSQTLLLVFLSASIVIQGIWITDLLINVLFTKTSILGASEYIFKSNFSKLEILSTMRHFFIVPLEFFALLFLKKLPKNFNKFFLYLFISISFFLIPSLFFGAEENMNYVYAPSFEVNSFFSNPVIYFISFFVFLIVSSSLIGILFYKILNNKKIFSLKHIKIYFWITLILVLLVSIKISIMIINLRA